MLLDIKCSRCGEVKDITLFVPNKRCINGVEKTCRSCKQEVQNKYRQRKYLEVGHWPWATQLEKHKTYCRNWDAANINTKRAYTAHYRAKCKYATPIWADLNAIKQFYKHCPVGHHVDHIIPLNGELVSGLHILSNLQYLPAKDNLQKGNKFYADELRSYESADAGRSAATGY